MDLDLLKTPGPTITALTAPFWAAAEEGRLSMQHCEDCESAIFYPRPICPHCWSQRLVWRDGSGRGRLKSFTIVQKPGHPGWIPVAPYAVGLVELEEGPTMLSFILRDNQEELAIGSPVEMIPTRIGGRTLPAFRQTQSQGKGMI
ncbi:OB-fold domain-containing protein (plasmid) [Shinella sumterensis]|nr:OB-fold domain-containing protein [Shinella sumterensis]